MFCWILTLAFDRNVPSYIDTCVNDAIDNEFGDTVKSFNRSGHHGTLPVIVWQYRWP